ncbi:endonuclease/exonuclease/phosphatase family protein [Brachybacterium sp. DNPG3]
MPSTISRRGALTAAAAATLGIPVLRGIEQPAAAEAFGARGANVRFATYNAALNRATEGGLIADLKNGTNTQAKAIAQVIQINNPDVLLLNEFDHDDDGEALELFRSKYLQVGQSGCTPVYYPYSYSAPVNTGVQSGLDLNGDGSASGPDDAWGYGDFPGQYGMVVLSRYPILTEQVRTFQKLLWSAMPSSLLPVEHYGAEIAAKLRLSSKSHWDVPVQLGNDTVHVLAAHPTPPGFDGDEKRNKRRNYDEIRLWADYITGGGSASWIVDDEGTGGGLESGASFVVMGDMNSDPADGDSWPGAITQLTRHPRIRDTKPASEGGAEAATTQGGINAEHTTDPRYDTADFAEDGGPGNLRVDYVLPSKDLHHVSSGVYWPASGQPGSELTGVHPFPTSDHRLVRVDIRMTRL